MSDPQDQSLARAYELIEMDRLDEARLILEPLLTEDQDNPDVWWLYAHAVDDPAEARQALVRVQELSPDYPGAAELQHQIEQDSSPSESVAASADDDLDFDDDFDLDDDEEVKPEPRRSLVRPLLLVALLAVVIVLLLVALNPFGGTDDPEPTQIAQTEPTPTQEMLAFPPDEETPEVDVPATEEPMDFAPGPDIEEDVDLTEPDATPKPAEPDSDAEDEESEAAVDENAEEELSPQSATDFNALVAALSEEVELFSDTTEIVQTAEFGSTLLVSVCSEVGDQLRESITQFMLTAANESGNLPEGLDAVGVRLIDCADGSSINTLAVSYATARDYNEGVIDQDMYRSQWRAIG